MTALRTMWGINLEYISNNFGKMYYDYCIDTSNNYIISKDILMLGNYILLSDKGKYISDSIISQMFYIDKN
jgi:oxygen-independent coproporphyrinogen III oxidase